MDQKDIQQRVIRLLKNNNFGARLIDPFSTEESLLFRGIIDSFGLFAFIAVLQKEFNLTINDKEIHPGNFESIDNITYFIMRKIDITIPEI